MLQLPDQVFIFKCQGSQWFIWQWVGFLPFYWGKEASLAHFLLLYEQKMRQGSEKHSTEEEWTMIINTVKPSIWVVRRIYFSQHLSTLSVVPMATGTRRTSFFHLLWKKKNHTQDMNHTEGKAEYHLQVGWLERLELQTNIKEWFVKTKQVKRL